MTEMGMLLFIADEATSHYELLVTLFVMFVAAKLAAELFERLKQPTVPGEIIAGIIIGPSVLGLVAPTILTNALSEIGVIFLLFLVGLQTRPKDIFKVGVRATAVAVFGVIVPFVAGYFFSRAYGMPGIEAIFIGAAMVATSVGITARVLGQMGLLSLTTSRIILGAAVIDDILGLIILSVVSSVAKGGINYPQIITTTALAIGFTLFVALLGEKAVRKVHPKVERLRLGHSVFLFGLALCLGLAFVASYIGVAAIIGAFLAGMALSESVEGTDMPRQAEAVTEFVLPFFLTNIGMQLKLQAFFSKEAIVLAIAITLIAVVTKIIGCGLASLTLGWKPALQIGVGMVPRGEVGIVVAQIGYGLAAVTDSAYGVVLFMAIATTLIAPPFLTRLYRGEQTVPASPIIDSSATGPG